MRSLTLALICAVSLTSAYAATNWTVLLSETGKRLEIDKGSIAPEGKTKRMLVTSQIALENAIIDPKTSSNYQIIRVQYNFDCGEHTYKTTKRAYYKNDSELLREDSLISPDEHPVRAGTPIDRVMKEVCLYQSPANGSKKNDPNVMEKVNKAAKGVQESNEKLVAAAVKKELRTFANVDAIKPAPTRKRAEPPTLADNEKPAEAKRSAQSSPMRAECAHGSQQAPIDIKDGFAVDLDPIQFSYVPAAFTVKDGRDLLQVNTAGGGFSLLGKQYTLSRVDFRRPAETTINGQRHAMEVELIHKASDGQTAIVSVMLTTGSENAFIQMALNYIPLEKGGELTPPKQRIDLNNLLPSERRYYTFMGSLPTASCKEEALWIVLKTPVQISAEQLSIFQRLYAPNARPTQPANGRIIKESR